MTKFSYELKQQNQIFRIRSYIFKGILGTHFIFMIAKYY